MTTDSIPKLHHGGLDMARGKSKKKGRKKGKTPDGAIMKGDVPMTKNGKKVKK